MSRNRLSFQSNNSRHSHDISAGYSASISTGMIIPQYFHILGPGDSIYYSSRMFARLKDVVTAFLGEIDVHLDSFFVPLQMLYTPFGQIYAQTDDFISSFFDPDNFPKTDAFPLLNVKGSIESKNNSDGSITAFECHGKSMFRMLDAFDLNPLGVCSDSQQERESYQSESAIDDQVTYNPLIAPWIVAAYQAIYQRYYRNDEIERLNISSYNFDDHYSQASFIDRNYLDCRYVQRPTDYFSSVRVSPISSAINSFLDTTDSNGGSPDAILNKVDSFLTSGGTYPFETYAQSYNSVLQRSNALSAFNHVSTNSSETKSGNNIFSSLSVSNIRALFAVDKFSRIYGRADKTYDDQILAHFGVHIPHDVKHDITHLKHNRAVLQSDPIYGTANVVAPLNNNLITTLGQVGGQGQVSFSSEKDKFTAPVHGVFMIVAYVTVKPRYVGTFNKLHLLTERMRLPIVEFDKLGAQPMYAFEASPIYFQSADAISTRIGWQNRYEEFKKKYNRVSWVYYSGGYGHGSTNSNSYGPWVISQMPYQRGLTDGVLPTIPGQGSPVSSFVPAWTLWQSPLSLDNVMVKRFDYSWNNTYFEQPHLILQSDPILTEFFCDAKLVSWMSETGEPDL